MRSQASILVVDDDPVHLRIYGWIMNAAGFRAVTAQVVCSNVCLPDNDNFDVVVLDYRLTGMLTAVEAARQIRKNIPMCPSSSSPTCLKCRTTLRPMRNDSCAKVSRKS